MNLRTLISLLLVAPSVPAFATRATRLRAGICARQAKEAAAIGLRGQDPDGRVHTAFLRTRGKGPYIEIFAGANELSPRVANIALPKEVGELIAAGKLEQLDGVVVRQARLGKTLSFRVEGADHRQNPRLELKFETPEQTLKIRGATTVHDSKASF